MLEPELGTDVGVFLGRLEELLARQRGEEFADARSKAGPHELLDGRLGELESADGRGLDDGPLLVAEAVEARSHERVDRCRDGEVGEIAGGLPAAVRLAQQAVVDEHRQHLLDEERVALGSRHDPSAERCGDPVAAEQVLDDQAGGVGRKRLEVKAEAVVSRGARIPAVENVLPRRAHEQHGRVSRLDDVVDELQERRLGPVQIVEDGDDRLLPREALEELASGPEDLLDRELLKRVSHRRARCGHAPRRRRRVPSAGPRRHRRNPPPGSRPPRGRPRPAART